MSALANVREPIDSFFDRVIVNADDQDVYEGTVSISLSNIHRSIATIADFSLIEDVVSDNKSNRQVA